MNQNFLPFAFFENHLIPFTEAKMSIATHALHYGTAAFGGLRGTVDQNEPRGVFLFRLDRHCKRLSQSAKFLNYQLDANFVQEKIIDFIKANKPSKDFYIRPLVYASDLGISPRLHNLEKDFLIYGLELGDYLSPDGVTCRISSWYRQEDRSLPLRGKISAAYITSSLAKTEAVESGFDEAILLNTQGKVSEATGMNLFMVRDGVIYTSSFEQDILEGITRDSVMTIATDLGYKVVERPIDKTELFIADEVFLTGTAARVTPVKSVENYALPERKPIADKIREVFNKVVVGKEVKYKAWVTRVGW